MFFWGMKMTNIRNETNQEILKMIGSIFMFSHHNKSFLAPPVKQIVNE